MINLNQLRAFYQAAKCQNVSLAAKHLFISQPAVTAQVKLFEDSCGLKLFKKWGRNLILTDAGKTLFNYARKIFEYERKIENAVTMIHGLVELKNEVVIIAKADDHPNIAFIPFSREELVLILPPNHRLANKSSINFKQRDKENAVPGDGGPDGENAC